MKCYFIHIYVFMIMIMTIRIAMHNTLMKAEWGGG